MELYEKSGVQGFSLPIHYSARPRLTMSRTVLLLNAVKATRRSIPRTLAPVNPGVSLCRRKAISTTPAPITRACSAC